MDTLVDAGLVPDTSKWKYPTSPTVSISLHLSANISVVVFHVSLYATRGAESMVCD